MSIKQGPGRGPDLLATSGEETPSESVDRVLRAAAEAAPWLQAAPPGRRAKLLVALADALDLARDDLVPIGVEETGLPSERLMGEVARTSGQLRAFAAAVLDGSFLEVVLDSRDPDANPPRPDLRRLLTPLGPVLVFAASNFPFAFSVLGGDTASALAAGCPVVVKAHPGHPRLSAACAALAAEVARDESAPAGLIGIIFGTEAGVRALSAPLIKAVGFTGSVAGGRALEQIAHNRPDPIPFYGELGSTNPVIVTPAATQQRGADIVTGFVTSFTLGAGQFCTKPGLLFLPAGHGLSDALASAVASAPPARLLTPSIYETFLAGRTRLQEHAGVAVLAESRAETSEASLQVAPILLRTNLAGWLSDQDVLGDECFGPLALVIEYDDPSALLAAVSAIAGSLAATVHLVDDDEDWVVELLAELANRTGRLVVNGWPTGVAVAWAMQHGGPHPVTTNALHTSVGATALRRWLRPVAYQDVPENLLPSALRSDNPWRLPRRIDGVAVPAPVAHESAPGF